ncbi:glycoside hydrolase domain-containing protein [uncultured Parabacteroides sp.]|uniref:glycoside hydrolase domain-containing protein n=1 Tax=uncultured Parabacteroides sp. TaxID=512312 RepID=UPI00262C0161|nr:glycoside hydrolase domain-containing protein [uncultured Parabacteroides sp.]
MWMHFKWNLFIGVFLSLSCLVQAQEEVTNAFDDLKRQGAVVEEENSEMRQKASSEAVEALMRENPVSGYFCFTEDRMHDIRMTDAIPQRWMDRPAVLRTKLSGDCRPGEFYTWQVGIFAPYKTLSDVSVSFSDWKNERGDKIPASAFRCFNSGGTDTYGKSFKKQVNVNKGDVQALWMGGDIPTDASGVYKGFVLIQPAHAQPVKIACELQVKGRTIDDKGDAQGWRKSRLRWLDSSIGNLPEPTSPYIPVKMEKHTISWLGGTMALSDAGLPRSISTHYDSDNQLSASINNALLAEEMTFVIETQQGKENWKTGSIRITERNRASASWTVNSRSRNFQLICTGNFGFDGLANYKIEVKALNDVKVKDMRLEVPYTSYAAKYMMGLGHKGGFRPDSLIRWQWNTDNHQDKIWMGNVNAGLNFCFKDENYVRPLVNIYYALGKLNLPESWGNSNKGGIDIIPEENGCVLLNAYSGERLMRKGETLHYNFNMLVTPVKPLNLKELAEKHFYHSNSDVSAGYIPAALQAGADMVNVHHKKDIYPFINYPYYDDAIPDLKQFIAKAHQKELDVRLYYTTRELTVKIPELWALRSLGTEVIHDGPGPETRTLIHRNGPHEWLNKNLKTHFIPAWYNAFKEGKYAGDMDISVITTPDSRWNNYYLEGLDWMIKNLGLDGIYIDDSALDHQTMQRARRVMDADGKRRLIDMHSWNHMNQWAGYANSLHLYLELLPYVDRTWIGEGFGFYNTPDFWLVEMSGIPFGLMSETLDARNVFRGMVYGMLPRLPWSGNPVPLWKLWDEFGMKDARLRGYWDERCPVKTGNESIIATAYVKDDRALVVLANWTDLPQTAHLSFDEELLGFKPSSCLLPEIREVQWKGSLSFQKPCEIMGRGGLILLLEK